MGYNQIKCEVLAPFVYPTSAEHQKREKMLKESQVAFT